MGFLKEQIPKYVILEKSIERVKEILSKYEINAYRKANEDKKNRYNRLMELAELRNLTIPQSWYDVEITDIDIILRIDEFLTEEISWISEHNYLFDSYNPEIETVNMTSTLAELPSDRKIDDERKKYQDIIVKEFGLETLELFETKKMELFFNQSLTSIYENSVSINQIPNMLRRRKNT